MIAWPERRAYPQGTHKHRLSRAWYLDRYMPGVSRCAIGHEILDQPATLLDLAHDDTGQFYIGLACRPHNRGDAHGRPHANHWGGRSWGRAGPKIGPKAAR